MRTSSYAIYVDLPNHRDQILLVHGYTGAFDRVSHKVGAYLRSNEVGRAPKPLYGEWSSEDLNLGEVQGLSDSTVELLEKRGYLTSLTPEEEEEKFSRIARHLHATGVAARPSYLFMPTYNCNLRCSYCFQDEMRTDPALRHLLRVMSPEMIDRLFLGMEDLEGQLPSVEGPRRRRIGFFGGEPLLRLTRPAVERVVEKALAMGEADFWAVSNATELDAYESLLGPERIADIQVTLDGPPAEHDKRRIYADGSGSYERIANNIDMALDLGVRVSIRVNLDRANIEHLPALARDLRARGWHGRDNFSLYTAPIRAANEKTDRKSVFTSWQLDLEIDRLRETHEEMELVGRPDDSLKGKVRQIFDKMSDPMPDYRASFCSAHTNMFIFDAFGDIYACWEYTGDPKVRIGSVDADGRMHLNQEISDTWRKRNVTSNPVCRKCRYALHCGGGCAVLAMRSSGKFFSNHCDHFQKRFRASVAEAYEDFVQGRDSLHQDRVCDL